MNGTFIPQQKKLSVAAIIGMIGAMLFSIAAACMVFLPVTSTPGVNNPPNAFQMSLIGESGQAFMNNIWSQVASKLSTAPGDWQFYYIASFIIIIAATAAFFGLIFCALMIVLGKALSIKHGGRVLALIFGIFAFLIAAFMLVWTLVFIGSAQKLGVADKSTVIGIGPILMASFSFVALIFCFIGLGDRSAYAKTGAPAQNPYVPNAPYANPNANTADPYVSAQPAPQQFQQPVQPAPQQFQQPVQPAPQQFQQPVQPAPQQFQQPVQPAPQQFQPQPVPVPVPVQQADDQPTVAQMGAIEGLSGDYKGASINLKPGEKLLIGRDPQSCNIVISSEKKDISRTHCSVKYDPYTDSFKVIDMSSNGTFVNGQRLIKDQEMQFRAGTVLSLGSGENQFKLKKM